MMMIGGMLRYEGIGGRANGRASRHDVDHPI